MKVKTIFGNITNVYYDNGYYVEFDEYNNDADTGRIYSAGEISTHIMTARAGMEIEVPFTM